YNSCGTFRDSILLEQPLCFFQILSREEHARLNRLLLIAQSLDDVQVISDQALFRVIAQNNIVELGRQRVSEPYRRTRQESQHADASSFVAFAGNDDLGVKTGRFQVRPQGAHGVEGAGWGPRGFNQVIDKRIVPEYLEPHSA